MVHFSAGSCCSSAAAHALRPTYAICAVQSKGAATPTRTFKATGTLYVFDSCNAEALPKWEMAPQARLQDWRAPRREHVQALFSKAPSLHRHRHTPATGLECQSSVPPARSMAAPPNRATRRCHTSDRRPASLSIPHRKPHAMTRGRHDTSTTTSARATRTVPPALRYMDYQYHACTNAATHCSHLEPTRARARDATVRTASHCGCCSLELCFAHANAALPLHP